MNVLKSAITCKQCRNILKKPILLPCGESVCLEHVQNLPDNIYYCKFCTQEHTILNGELYMNKSLENLINANLCNVNLGDEYSNALDDCKQLGELISEFETMRKDPAYFINDTLTKLRNQTDILREELKLFIDKEANKIIDELNQYERDCKSKLETNEFKMSMLKIDTEMETIKKELNDWENQLSYFDSKQEKLKTIYEKCRKNAATLRRKTFNFKQELLAYNLQQHFDNLKNYPNIVKNIELGNYSFE